METGCAVFFFLLIPEKDRPLSKKKAEDQSLNVLQMGRSKRQSQTIGKGGGEVSQFKWILLTAAITNLGLERFKGGPFSYSESGSVLLVHPWQMSGSCLELPIRGIP